MKLRRIALAIGLVIVALFLGNTAANATSNPSDIAHTLSVSTATVISGLHGEICSSTNPQYIIHSGGGTLDVKPGHAVYTVANTPNGQWASPYITAGYDDSISSELCNTHEIPGSDGLYYKSYALPVAANSDGYPTTSIHTLTIDSEFRGDTGYDLWFTANPKNNSYADMANGGSNTTEIMIWTSHPHLGNQSTNYNSYPVMVDGRRWEITIGLARNGHGKSSTYPNGWNVVNFIAPNVHIGNVVVHNLHLNKFIAYTESQGWMNSSDYLMAIDAGMEISNNGTNSAVVGYSLSDVK
jgi:hypothetical protein